MVNYDVSISNYSPWHGQDIKNAIIKRGVTSIGGGTFSGCERLTIKGYTDSYAESYANEKNILFESLDEAPAHKYGDANNDCSVTIADATTILQYIANKEKYPIADEIRPYVDVDGVAGISGSDALTIQKIDAGLVNEADLPLPVK